VKKAYIPQKLRRQVFERAKEMCEYCLSKSDLLGTDLEVEHIIPESLGGASSLDNLCASCSTCNRHKASKVWAIDPNTGRGTRLFHRANKNGSDISAGVKTEP